MGNFGCLVTCVFVFCVITSTLDEAGFRVMMNSTINQPTPRLWEERTSLRTRA